MGNKSSTIPFLPGPWRVSPFDGDRGTTYYVLADKGRVAECREPANARLIAAAPDLLAALQRSLNWLSSYQGGGALGCYDQARTAISKALGEGS